MPIASSSSVPSNYRIPPPVGGGLGLINSKNVFIYLTSMLDYK